MGRIGFTLLGTFLGYCAGALAGTLLGMLWIGVFPPDRVAGGPEAGFGTVMGASMAGQALGIIAGAILGWRKGTLRGDAGAT